MAQGMQGAMGGAGPSAGAPAGKADKRIEEVGVDDDAGSDNASPMPPMPPMPAGMPAGMPDMAGGMDMSKGLDMMSNMTPEMMQARPPNAPRTAPEPARAVPLAVQAS